jgi:hypothetical protein
VTLTAGSPPSRALRGRVVLVVGAGDPLARDVSLHLAARGAAIVAAGPALDPVVATAGLVAAQGGTVRVIEDTVPPLLGRALLTAAARTLDLVTDVLVAPSAFPSREAAATAARDLGLTLEPGGLSLLLDVPQDAGARPDPAPFLARFLAGLPEDVTADHPFLG